MGRRPARPAGAVVARRPRRAAPICPRRCPGPPLQPETRESAVLVPLFEQDGEARLVLTQRPDTMANHRGEVAFPGGKVDPRVDRRAARRRAPRGGGGDRPPPRRGRRDRRARHDAHGLRAIPDRAVRRADRGAARPRPRSARGRARLRRRRSRSCSSDEVHHEERVGASSARTARCTSSSSPTRPSGARPARILAGFLAHLMRVPLIDGLWPGVPEGGR